MNNTYSGFDENHDEAMPKWFDKALAKKQFVPAVDASGSSIPMSALGKFIDDRDVILDGSKFVVRTAGSVAYFTNLLKEAGYSL